MTSNPNEQKTEVGYLGHQNTLSGDANLSKCGGSHLEHAQDEGLDEEEEEEEEEDVDFNPLLKETMSLEASSSLSSEVEGLDADVVDSGETNVALASNLLSNPSDRVQDYAVGDSDHGEEIVMQSIVSSGGVCENELEETSVRPMKRKSVLITQTQQEIYHEKDDSLFTDTYTASEEFNNTTNSRNPIMDLDDKDAICMRTRARYSLASFTLDELETFLQETDDDDDLQHVDDEEEYKKFLAAVLLGGDGDSQAIHENEHVDDEDEDNDADFELEIEEALESDLDERARPEQEEEHGAATRRPETRQNKRQKTSDKKKILEPSNRRLRPLLPNAPIASFPAPDGKSLMPGTDSHHNLSSTHNGFLNGFTQHQLGQLHCLIHEHVQLLIQVFSLCVLEPSRQHIASQVQDLIAELLHRRNQETWRRVSYGPYPCLSIVPPHIHPSAADTLSNSLTSQSNFDPSHSSGTHEVLTSDAISPSKGRHESLPTGQQGSFPTPNETIGVPSINGTIFSVLEVAALNLVANYMDDVSTARREYQRRYVDASGDTHFEREPLFPLHNQSSPEANTGRGTTTLASQKVPSLQSSNQPPKKTLAATLVERTKKQSVAPVPKEVAKLAQRFLPLFNPALFPHKPPPPPVVNRVLFNDAEDDLLALGLMEYNTDWTAIQQRFLPCKSKHQIFVRQKNRTSSKAPENSIKAVRRMKNSPLTAEEMGRIHEGLKVFKLDWMSIWRFVVPHRDPSLLPRLWRIANGTQKSYKSNEDKKQKRRLYEATRRRCRPAALASWQTSSEKEDFHTENAGGENISGGECVNEDEAYVHEAFLADWRPGASSSPASKIAVSNLRDKTPPVLSPFAPARSSIPSFELNHQVPEVHLKNPKSQFGLQPFQAHRGNNARVVKLAPDLPPLNLPPSVRIISQSAFTSYQGGAASIKVSTADTGRIGAATENLVPSMSGIGCHIPANPLKHGITNLQSKESRLGGNTCVAGEKGKSDLQMHPLLFQAPEDGNLPYYPLNCSSSSSRSLNFFGGSQPQLNLSLLHNPDQGLNSVNCFQKTSKSKGTPSSSCGIDFHPLLQRADDVDSYNSVAAHPSARAQKRSDVVPTDSWDSGNAFATGNKSPSLGRNANEPDLEIHLNFINREEKASASRDETDHNAIRLNLSTADSGTIIEAQTSSKVGSGDHPLDTESNNTSNYDISNVGDQSLPEIVMEQEELSDSEEEIGEHVQFEQEEMADSDGEDGSDYDQSVDMQEKESSPDGTRKKLDTYTDFDDQLTETTNCCISQHKEGESSSLCLRLNSSASDFQPNSSFKTDDDKECRSEEGPVAEEPLKETTTSTSTKKIDITEA